MIKFTAFSEVFVALLLDAPQSTLYDVLVSILLPHTFLNFTAFSDVFVGM